MHILFADAYFAPESTAYSHLEHDLILRLTREGHSIHIICPTPSRGIDKATRVAYRKRREETMYDGAVTVSRFRAPAEKQNPILRAFRYAICCRRFYRKAIRLSDTDVIFAASTPPTLGKYCGKAAQKLSRKLHKKIPFIYNLQDVFPDSLVNANLTKKGSILWKIGRRTENATYRGADKIITISDGFKRNIMEKGVPEDKIVVVPNWVDGEEVKPVERKDNILFDRYGLDRDRFYVCYSGNVGHSQNLGLLLAVAERVKKELPQVSFAIFGDGAAKPGFEKSVKEKGLDNILFFPYQPYEEISHVFSFGDVGLIISKAGIGGSSMPSKTFGVMSAGRPVLASFDADSELSAMIHTVGCGIAVPADNADALVAAIRELYEKRDALPAIGAHGREYVQTELAKEKCTAIYADTVKNCAETPAPDTVSV